MRAWDWVEAGLYPSEDDLIRDALRCLLRNRPDLRAGRWEAWLDAAACGRRLWLRRRRPGDRFQPLGMEGGKKLQDFFVDEKVPRSERDRLPLVVSPRGIVWVVGQRLDGRFRVRPQTRQLLHLRWE